MRGRNSHADHGAACRDVPCARRAAGHLHPLKAVARLRAPVRAARPGRAGHCHPLKAVPCPQLDRPAVRTGRLCKAPRRGQRVAQPGVRQRIEGIQLNGIFKAPDRLVVAAHACHNHADPRVRGHILGANVKRAPVALDGPSAVGLALHKQGVPAVGMRRRVLRIHVDCLLVQRQRLVVAPVEHCKGGQLQNGKGAAGVCGHCVPVARLRLCRAAKAPQRVAP